MSLRELPPLPRRILVRCPNWLGDVVMSTPGLRALRKRHPAAWIVAHVVEGLAPLLEGHPSIDEVWTLSERRRRPGALLREARRIAEGRFDLGIAIPESVSSALLMRLGRVGCVVGHARDPLRRALLHRVVAAPESGGSRRLVARERIVLDLMSALGAERGDPRLDLVVTAAGDRQVVDALGAAGAAGLRALERPPIVLAPGASFGSSKCWPVESFAALADRWSERGEPVVLVGGAAERARIEAVRDAMRHTGVVLAGTLDPAGLAALLRRSRLLIANDAGARHVASAFGIPSVVFFGPTALEKTDENLEHVAVLETEHACRPCYRRVCPIDHRCLRDIGVDEALEAGDRSLRRVADAQGRGDGSERSARASRHP